MRYNLPIVATMAALLLAACAGTEPHPEGAAAAATSPPVALEADSRVSVVQAAGDDQLLESSVGAEVGGGLIDYRSRYSVAGGELVRKVGADFRSADEVPTQLARHSLDHEVRLSIPDWLGAPVQVVFDRSQGTVFTLDGDRHQESTRTRLSWDPFPLRLDVEWKAPRAMPAAGQPFDCLVEGRLRVPARELTPGLDSTLDLSRSDCLIRAPERQVEDLPMQAQGVAWRWGGNLDNAVRLNRLESAWDENGFPRVSSGYEVALSQHHSFMGWKMEADVALRQGSERDHLTDTADDSRWAVDLQLQRQFDLFALNARWMQAQDPLWFLPLASPVTRESVSLLFDFSAWLNQALPRSGARMSTSLEHTEQSDGSDDNRVNWNFSISW